LAVIAHSKFLIEHLAPKNEKKMLNKIKNGKDNYQKLN
jgi:hypothetical protein